jgi:hypothetical protein
MESWQWNGHRLGPAPWEISYVGCKMWLAMEEVEDDGNRWSKGEGK